jgi:hypothetical protein
MPESVTFEQTIAFTASASFRATIAFAGTVVFSFSHTFDRTIFVGASGAFGDTMKFDGSLAYRETQSFSQSVRFLNSATFVGSSFLRPSQSFLASSALPATPDYSPQTDQLPYSAGLSSSLREFGADAQESNRAAVISAVGGGMSAVAILAALLLLVWLKGRKGKSIPSEDTATTMEAQVTPTITEETDFMSEYGLSDDFEIVDSCADPSDIPRLNTIHSYEDDSPFGSEHNPNELDDESLGQSDLDIDEGY